MPVPVTEAVSPRRLIRDEVFLRLLDAIVQGDLTPGEQLYDAEIEKWVGVSRTPVREALNQLAAMGLVEIMPQKRTRVTPISAERVRALIETIGVLLRGIVRDATPLLTDRDKDALRAFADRAGSGPEMAELIRDRFLTEGFMNVFIRRLDNKTIGRLFNRHLPEVRRAFNAAPSTRAFEAGVPHLKTIVDAAVSGDAATAASGVGDFWNEALGLLVEDYSELEKKNS